MCAAPQMSGLTEGKHQLHLNITDAVGNTNSIDPIVWVVDFGAPRSATIGILQPHTSAC